MRPFNRRINANVATLFINGTLFQPTFPNMAVKLLHQDHIDNRCYDVATSRKRPPLKATDHVLFINSQLGPNIDVMNTAVAGQNAGNEDIIDPKKRRCFRLFDEETGRSHSRYVSPS